MEEPTAHPASRTRKRPHHRRRASACNSVSIGLMLLSAIAAPVRAATDLTSLSLEQLLDVSIVGASKYAQSQNEVAASASIITRQEIQAFGWRTLGEALSSLPGLYSTYNRQETSIGARGFGLPGDLNTNILVMMDGIRVNDPIYDAGRFGWDFPLDMDMIERIEFIPGPGGAVYGQNAMFGVVNVITRSGAGLAGAELAVAYQEPQVLRQGRASWGDVLANGTDIAVSMTGLESRGQDLFYDFGPLPVSGVAVDMDGQKNQQFFAHVGRGAWSVEEIYGWGKKEDPTASFFSTPLVPGQSQALTTTLTQVKYQDDIGAALHLNARVFNGTSDLVESLFVEDGRYQTRGHSEWRGAEFALLFTAPAGHKLMVGVEGQDTPVIDQSLHGVGFVNPLHDFLIQTPGYRVGVYFQDEWRIAAKLSATLGWREDTNDVTGTKASPRAALIWQAESSTTLKALYGIAHRAPNAYERDYGDGNSQIANPALQGETIHTFEIVGDQRFGRTFAMRLSVYQWEVSHLITQVYDPYSGIPPQYQSGPQADAHGAELSADKTWDTGARLRASVSQQDAHYDLGGAALLNSPAHLGKLNASTPLPVAGLRLGYEFRYDSSRLTRDGTTLGGYGLSNFVLSTGALHAGLDLGIGLYNVFDKRYALPGALNNWQNSFEQDGRSIRLTLRQQF
jgi:iron complex outermembrane receptor protein